MSRIKNKLKGSANTAVSSFMEMANNLGRAALHVIMPDNVEHYLCTLELLNVEGEQQGFLSFSVMPENITESHTPIQTMTKTHSGIVTVFSDTFAPVDINISGQFGRKFRIVAKCKDPIDINKKAFFGLNLGKVGNAVTGFLKDNGVAVKTGYGLTKVLEHMLQYSNKTDEWGRPYFLVFRNYAFNTAYVVNVMGYTFTQNVATNMLWQYQMNLQAVADAKEFNLTKQAKNTFQFLTTVGANSIANGLTKITTKMIGL